MPQKIGGLEIRAELNEIEGRAGTFRLEPQAMSVLGLLAGEPGRVWSRDELMDCAWSGRVISDATLTGVISRLRHALREAGVDDCRIETRSKRGYRLVVDAARPLRQGWKRALLPVGASITALTLAIVLVTRQPAAVRLDLDIIAPGGEPTQVALWLPDRREGELRVDGESPLWIRVRPVSRDRDLLRLRLEARSLSHVVDVEQVVAFGERGQLALRTEDGQAHYLIRYVPSVASFPPAEEIPQENRSESAGAARTSR